MATTDLAALTVKQLMTEKARLERIASYVPGRLACSHLKEVAKIIRELERRNSNSG